jgi:excisionase family DNA binding protein
MTSREQLSPDDLLTSSDVATLLQMNRASVNKWVRDGLLRAYKTPGGHHRIRVTDLVAFLTVHELPVPGSLTEVMRRRVLVVDDDQRHLQTIRRALKPYAAAVELELVTNGIDALVRIGEFRPHAILLDVVMPDIDGIEVLKRLRQLETTKDTNIVMTSGKLTQKIKEAALEAGASSCLQKPMALDVLLQELGIQSMVAPPLMPLRSSARGL